MGDDSEADALLKWLEESGRALELRVMRAFRQHAHVRHSVTYTDPESQKSREIDVVARFYNRSLAKQAQLDVVVECKTGKPGSQWVAFRDETTPARFLADEDAWTTPTEPGKRSAFADAWKWRPPFTDRINVSSIVTAHDGRDTAHAAFQQLLSAVEGHVQHVSRYEAEPVNKYGDSTGEEFLSSAVEAAVIGVVITNVPIYVADLDADNSPQVAAAEIVAVPMGRRDPTGPARIFIARETALHSIVADLHNAAERL